MYKLMFHEEPFKEMKRGSAVSEGSWGVENMCRNKSVGSPQENKAFNKAEKKWQHSKIDTGKNRNYR